MITLRTAMRLAGVMAISMFFNAPAHASIIVDDISQPAFSILPDRTGTLSIASELADLSRVLESSRELLAVNSGSRAALTGSSDGTALSAFEQRSLQNLPHDAVVHANWDAAVLTEAGPTARERRTSVARSAHLTIVHATAPAASMILQTREEQIVAVHDAHLAAGAFVVGFPYFTGVNYDHINGGRYTFIEEVIAPPAETVPTSAQRSRGWRWNVLRV